MSRRRELPLILAVIDAAMVLLAAYVAWHIRFTLRVPRYIPGGEAPDPGHYMVGALIMAAIVVASFFLVGVYRRRRGVQFVDELFSVVAGMVVASLVGLAATGLYHEFPYSRVTFLYWAVLAVILISLGRYALRRAIAARRARGIGVERALMVGWGDGADVLAQRLRMFPDYGYRLVGVLTDHLGAGDKAGALDVVGRVDDLERVIERERVDVVFVALSDVQAERTVQLIERCRHCHVDFRILPGILQLMSAQVTTDQIDGIPLIQYRQGLDVDPLKAAMKRLFDIVVAGLGMVAISPLLLLIAVLVKLSSPGPAMIHQERTGMGGSRIRIHKFRSMRVNAEAESGPVWAVADDPRRTWIGKWLRRFSLDELPQLWNIVAGEMSLVGPRAERPEFVAEFGRRMPRYDDRHQVRPGLTGWAQANDLRGQTPVEERLTYDLYYIENWSLAFDLKIILLTVARVWTHKNAY